MFPGKHVLVNGVVVSTELDRWFIYADLRMVFGIAGACDCFTSFGTFICHDMTRLGFPTTSSMIDDFVGAATTAQAVKARAHLRGRLEATGLGWKEAKTMLGPSIEHMGVEMDNAADG